MSADAQPRKRKDKKKKKDEREGLGEKPPMTPPPIITPPSTPTGSLSPDEVMHIYKEGKVGGSAFTKVLFFGIMSALLITISIVIMSAPHRDTVTETVAKDGEGAAGDSGWSLGLGEWSPFSFGPDEGHEEAHEEEHEGHDEEQGHGEEGEHDEHDEHEHVEEQDEGGIMSWLGWGGGSSGEHEAGAAEEHTSEEHAEEPAAEGLGSWFGWGGGEESAAEEQPEAAETSTGSSWFGWGDTTEEPAPAEEEHETEDAKEEPAEEEPSEEVISKPSKSIKHKEEVVEEEEEEEEDTKQEEVEEDEAEKPQEKEEEDINASPELDDMMDDDEDDELTTFLRSLDIEPPRRESRHSQERAREQRAREQSAREQRIREEIAREHRIREEIAREQRIREERARELRLREERARELRMQEERAREQRIREERAREERIREERAREDRIREERAREERIREERAREERLREESARQRRVDVPDRSPPEQDETEPDVEDEKPAVQVKRRKSVQVDEEDDELFPEAAEALRLEHTSAEATDEADDGDKADEGVEEESPFGQDEDPSEELAQREREEEEEAVKEKVFETKSKPMAGSAAAKASEFLAERAAERATRETQAPLREPPINFPPPPSFSPEPSDEEEEFSDQEQRYSGEEEGVDEEELVEEEEKLGEGDSPLGSDIELNLEGSEPELEDEEEEEEMSEDEIVPPAPTVTKKTVTSTPAPSQHQRRSGGPQAYEHEDITDDYDWAIKEELDMADDEFQGNPSGCLHVYQTLQAKHDNSPRVRVGIAKCLDYLSKEANSNRLLEFAIYAYRRALKLPLKDKLFLETAQTLVSRLRFRGFIDQTMEVHELLVSRFSDDPKHRNDLAISYLMINNLKEAERVLNKTLVSWPGDAIARAHYGLTLKLQGKHEESVPHLETGLQLDEQATKDARFYFHLGDALVRIGRTDRALKIYERGVTLGLFRSLYQRSLYNVDRLTARPWWTHEQTTYSSFFKKLESNWKAIREEGLQAIQYKKGFLDEAESLRDTGDWKQFELYARGVRNSKNCEITRVTCQLIGEFEAAKGCRRGQAKFSLMETGTHVWPHCGPTNCRLRAHLGLVVPPGPEIRVANITRVWEEGKVIIFDDSFEHEVWHRGTKPRLVLIVDVWHPELTPSEKKSLSPI